MIRKWFNHVLVMCLVACACALMTGCPKDSGASQSANNSNSGGAGVRAPSGVYESSLPDGTTMRLDFRDGGLVKMIMIESGVEEIYDGQWNMNGESILVQGAEGLMLQMNWKDDALACDFGGITMIYKKK